MQAFGALLMSAVIAASAPAARQALQRADARAAAAGEAYVAELDADWNVAREIRVSCPVESGCAVDLPLADPALAAVHVRFDAVRGGTMAVTSRLEDRTGRASAAEDEVLSLDRTGFGASHYEARMTPAGGDGRIIMMAVKVSGWTAPGAPGAGSGPART